MKFTYLFASLTILLLLSCSSDNKPPDGKGLDQGQYAKERKIITDYIEKNGLDMKVTNSGMFYHLEKPGGPIDLNRYGSDARVVAHYHGTFLDGKVFDSSVDRGRPFAFPLGTVLFGWREAIRMMGEGGKGTFIIPSHMAYGANGLPGRVEPNTILMFDIELLQIGD